MYAATRGVVVSVKILNPLLRRLTANKENNHGSSLEIHSLHVTGRQVLRIGNLRKSCKVSCCLPGDARKRLRPKM